MRIVKKTMIRAVCLVLAVLVALSALGVGIAAFL